MEAVTLMPSEQVSKPYPPDVSEEEWAFVAPYLALVRADAPHREHDRREVYNGMRSIVKCGCPWSGCGYRLRAEVSGAGRPNRA